MASVFCHIVTFRSARAVVPALRALLAQEGFEIGKSLFIEITDNAPGDSVAPVINSEFGKTIRVVQNRQNLGFAGAHNQGAHRFLASQADYFFVLNPDVALAPNAIKYLTDAIENDDRAGMATPKLYRADADLRPLEPLVIDAAGMRFDPALRHFDRGSGEVEEGRYDEGVYVAGGTGAALLLSRPCLQDLLLVTENDRDSERVYPALAEERELRAPLFDEAFFAYREDAELAWRSLRYGWRCRYVPEAVGYHTRVVLPERRKELDHSINRWSVRNRFLMQLVHFSPGISPRVTLEGFLWRNTVVILGVALREWGSLSAFRDLAKLFRRALSRRKEVRKREKLLPVELREWFTREQHRLHTAPRPAPLTHEEAQARSSRGEGEPNRAPHR